MSESAPLHESTADRDPFVLLRRWIADGAAIPLEEPHAAVLATASADGAPSARVVLIKDVSASGITFFTNYDSRKARELVANPRAALCLHWQPLRRQVRVTGDVARAEPAISDAYHRSRPRGSQLGAWASPQSDVVAGREELDRRVSETEARFRATDDVPRPPHWGGFRLLPREIEFWVHRDDRLHDRLRYRRTGDEWVLERLAP